MEKNTAAWSWSFFSSFGGIAMGIKLRNLYVFVQKVENERFWMELLEFDGKMDLIACEFGIVDNGRNITDRLQTKSQNEE